MLYAWFQAHQPGKQSHSTGRTTVMSMCVIRRHALQNSDCIGSRRNGKWFPLMVSWLLLTSSPTSSVTVHVLPAYCCNAAGHCCKLNPGHYVTMMKSSCTHRLFNSAAERVMCNLRHRLFSHLMNQEIGFFDRIRTGELMNRLSEVLHTCNHPSGSVSHSP